MPDSSKKCPIRPNVSHFSTHSVLSGCDRRFPSLLGFSLVMVDPRTIRTLRRRNGWTQADLAARLGTDPVTVSRWERGVSRPRPSAQTRLRELAAPMPGGLAALVRLTGPVEAERVLLRRRLLACRPVRQHFGADPTTRLREVERARREQTSLKARAPDEIMNGTLTQALLAVHVILEESEVAHALCGGLAANLYRDEVRATSDVDLAIAIGPARLVDLVRSFEDDGWRAEPYWRRAEQLRLTRHDLPWVDWLVAATDYERAAIDRAVPAEIEGRIVRVLTAEDLIVFKLIAGKARDYEAVAAIINARGGRLDVDYITGWLDQIGTPEAWERAEVEARREAGG